MPTYVMSMYLIPLIVIEKIDKVRKKNSGRGWDKKKMSFDEIENYN